MDHPTAAALDTPPTTTPAPSPGVHRGVWRRYVTDVRDAADAESDVYRTVTPAAIADRKMVLVLVTTAVCLTANHFLASGRDPAWLVSLLRHARLDGLAGSLHAATTTSTHAEFHRLAFWAAVQVVGYVVPPVLLIRVVLRERVRDYGLRFRGVLHHGGTYALIFAIAFPALLAVSFSASFQAKYPFYDLAPREGLWPYMWAWWGLYALQFVALEFFFRGFVLHGLKHRLGYPAIFVMAVPYNMIHFGKPMAEALAAIGGGIVLGTLSLKTRSIWWGAGLHISIAASMDVLSLWHRGILF